MIGDPKGLGQASQHDRDEQQDGERSCPPTDGRRHPTWGTCNADPRPKHAPNVAKGGLERFTEYLDYT